MVLNIYCSDICTPQDPLNVDVVDVKKGPFTVLSVVGVGMVSDSVPKVSCSLGHVPSPSLIIMVSLYMLDFIRILLSIEYLIDLVVMFTFHILLV